MTALFKRIFARDRAQNRRTVQRILKRVCEELADYHGITSVVVTNRFGTILANVNGEDFPSWMLDDDVGVAQLIYQPEQQIRVLEDNNGVSVGTAAQGRVIVSTAFCVPEDGQPAYVDGLIDKLRAADQAVDAAFGLSSCEWPDRYSKQEKIDRILRV